MKNIIYKIVLAVLLFAFISCKEDSANVKDIKMDDLTEVNLKSSNKNLNISLLLDLSDRIDPVKYKNETMQYYLRDVAYIKSVSEAFYSHLSHKKVREMDDKIQLFFDPEPSNQNINAISNNLKYHIDKNNASLEKLEELKTVYKDNPKAIYELAIEDKKYVGSDIWKFIKTKVEDYCIDENSRNILIIFTDGYIYHEDGAISDENQTTFITPQFLRKNKLNTKNWETIMAEKDYGFISTNQDLSNLEILVLGINPDKNNLFGEYVVKKYWSDWFDKMKVKHYAIKTAELPSNLDNLIKDFILKK
ncbi:hypothetical protein HSX10_14545 [Winogradskyella undariae]|uniref:hypothetical protein n=1 Tax=Winogradskyella undariae TaxID=1285465 RepID=UPI00156B7CFF|nr:hypothetical protein [Winogradskyella undariae]NRR92790.1 hypothetical protein [Winogradskyella undariae]